MVELYDHQKLMISEAKPILEKFNLVYVAAETRTGKTLSTIFLLKDDYKRILVLTKKKAISSWESDLELAAAKNFKVINYEAIHKLKDFDYDVISGLSREITLKLKEVRPETLAQASRIPGVTPAAVQLIMITVRKNNQAKKSA